MTELKILPGKHSCGKKLNIRIFSVNNNHKIEAWIVYGICRKCNIVLITGIFFQEEEPMSNIDYVINYYTVAKEGKEFSVKNMEKEIKNMGDFKNEKK